MRQLSLFNVSWLRGNEKYGLASVGLSVILGAVASNRNKLLKPNWEQSKQIKRATYLFLYLGQAEGVDSGEISLNNDIFIEDGLLTSRLLNIK